MCELCAQRSCIHLHPDKTKLIRQSSRHTIFKTSINTRSDVIFDLTYFLCLDPLSLLLYILILDTANTQSVYIQLVHKVLFFPGSQMTFFFLLISSHLNDKSMH